jgi:hypothetical protein
MNKRGMNLTGDPQLRCDIHYYDFSAVIVVFVG